jgi:hypothetical protein
MHDRSNERSNEVTDQCSDDRAKGGANDNGNGKVHDIAAEDEIAKTLQHPESPAVRMTAAAQCYPISSRHQQKY